MLSENFMDLTKRQFTIKNNILKGNKVDLPRKNYNIGQNIFNALTKNPYAIGQVDAISEKISTYSEMKNRSVKCALWLQNQGIGSNDVISYCTNVHMDVYIPCFATFYVGAVYNAWHHEVTVAGARCLLNMVKPKVMFVSAEMVEIVAEAAKEENLNTKFVVFGKHPLFETLDDILEKHTASEVDAFRPVEVNPEHISIILFSSGTSGMPKAVEHSYFNLNSNLQYMFPFHPTSRMALWYSSMYWISGSYFMINTVLNRTTRLVHAAFDPDETAKFIEKYQVDWFFITPVLMTYCYKFNYLKRFNASSLKWIQTGGAKLSQQALETVRNSVPQASFAQGYGTTEAGTCITYQHTECKYLNSIGGVVSNMEVKIFDVLTGEALEQNKAGEICIKSQSSMTGYYKNPEATKEAYDEDGWLHTGDRGYYDQNGELYVMDRLKDVMKFRGHHVSPLEIEELLLGHSDILEAAVVSVPNSIDMEHPMAFVKKVPGSMVTAEELVELSLTLGETKKLWGGVQFLEDFPYTVSGKIKKTELREMAKAYAK